LLTEDILIRECIAQSVAQIWGRIFYYWVITIFSNDVF